MRNLFKNITFFLGSLFMVSAPLAGAATHTIDVLVVYTQGVKALYGEATETKISQLLQFTNQIYRDSDVDLELRLAGQQMVDYTDENSGQTALQDITFARVDAFKNIENLRQTLRADMVIFYRPYHESHGSCGQAWVGGMNAEGNFNPADNRQYMYSHIPINTCGDFSTAHELGHNMGLRHSRKQDGQGGAFAYALGHGEVGEFATIMAYQSSFMVDYWTGKAYKFSSPQLICKGQPCGISRENTTEGADAAYALSITTPQIAAYYSNEPLPSPASSLTSSSASSSSVHSSSATNHSSSSTPANNSNASSKAAQGNNNSAPATATSQNKTSDSGSGGGGTTAPSFFFVLLAALIFRKQKPSAITTHFIGK